MEPEDTLLDWRTSDVAAFYGVTDSAVRQWERAGKIPAGRRTPGGHRRFSSREVIAHRIERAS